MPPRKDPAALVIEFFDTASIESAQTVLGIGKSILKRRLAAAKVKPAAPVGNSLTPAQAAGFTSPEADS